MKTYWFYLEAYTFIFRGSNMNLIYNTLNGECLQVSSDSILCSILNEWENLDSGYCVLISENQLGNQLIHNFVDDIRAIFAGDIVDTDNSKKKPFVLKPVLHFLNDPAKLGQVEYKSLGENILSYIHEVSFYIGGTCNHSCRCCSLYNKQFLYCTNKNSNSELLIIEYYKKIFENLQIVKVKCLNFLGANVLKSKLLNELLLILNDYDFKVNIFVNYMNLDKFDYGSVADNVRFVILIHFPMKKNFTKELITDIKSYYFNIVVSSELELIEANELIDKYNIEGDIIPFFNGDNLSFFQKYVYIELSDIFAIPISRKQIFARQILNENLFGKLIVLSDGTVCSNMNVSPLGNLKETTLNELVYQEILNENSVWLLKRNASPCSDCVYKLLCPSPGNYELVMNKLNLCHVNDL